MKSKRVTAVDFYVYAHYTLDTNELFYIGKGRNKRAYRKTGRNKIWQSINKKHGHRVCILIDNLSESDALIQEILAIKEFNPRANLTKGGEGVSNIPSSLKGTKRPEFAGKNNPMYGKKAKHYMSEEDYINWKKNLSKSLKGRKKSEDFCKNLSRRNKGKANPMYGRIPWNKDRSHTKETRAKISEKAKNRSTVRKKIYWVDRQITDSAVNIAKILSSHPQSIRQAAREGILHKNHRFTYV